MNPEASGPPAAASEQAAILCAKHQVPLQIGKVSVTYQGHTYPVDVLRCPVCGQALIPEELARGRMLDVEQTLEEK
jgi:hypothetical protein